MTPKRKDEIMGEYLEISAEINKLSLIESVAATVVRIPAFFERIWTEGYNAGIEEGKRQKEREIAKNN